MDSEQTKTFKVASAEAELEVRISAMGLYRSVAYASVAIRRHFDGIWSCWHISARAAEPTALFHPDPRHVSNRLYRQVHLRTRLSGKQYGFDALDPLLWSETNYMLSGKSHARAVALVDEFLRSHAERQITDPAKRAILQRDLWAVFDWADQADLPHQTERREIMAKLAPIIRRLALSPDELASPPDGLAMQNHEFPSAYDPGRPNQAFLPTDLFDAGGPRVCLGARTMIWRRRCTIPLSPRVLSSLSSRAYPEDAMQRSRTSNDSRT